jgi:hypothetical protein
VKKSFNIQELLCQQVQESWIQAHAPLLIEIFPKTPRTPNEASWFCGSHNYKTKQNKLPSFIERLVLGFVVSKEGRQPNPKKIEAIVECIY